MYLYLDLVIILFYNWCQIYIVKGGKSLKNELVKMDLNGCFYTDCYLCQSGTKGGSHTRAGAHYSGLCMICEETGIVSRYDGEPGRSAYWCTTTHHKEIKNNNLKNAFTKQLNLFHKDRLTEPEAFKSKVESTHSKCLECQAKEGIYIKNSGADYILNSEAEYHQPAMKRAKI